MANPFAPSSTAPNGDLKASTKDLNTRYETLSSELVDRLRAIVGTTGVAMDAGSLRNYGSDETEDLNFSPAAVIYPSTTDEVAAVLAVAHSARLPVTPRGGGTGLSGGALPVRGGLVLSVEKMNQILDIDSHDLVAEVEAGVITGVLQDRLDALGLYYPPDPGSRDSCLIAGNLAENAAGPHSCKYGTTRNWVLGLEAVRADGTIFRTGGRNRKDVAGYDLTRLLLGSEGTLAVITRATLRLIGRPKASLVLLLPFPDLESGAAAVAAIFRDGFAPAACELLEAAAIEVVARVVDIPPQLHGHDAVLLIELDGDDRETLLEAAAGLSELTQRLGGGEIVAAEDAADQRRLWAIRRQVGTAVKHRSAYKEADTVVPRSKLAALVRAARAAALEHRLDVICYGHAGDGNLHVNILRGDLDEAEWQQRRDACERDLFERVVALGGSITGEHGVGWTQRDFLGLAVDPAAIELMRGIKQLFDPRGILNPDKIFPAPTP